MTHRERAERYVYKRLGKKFIEANVQSLESEFKRVEEEVRKEIKERPVEKVWFLCEGGDKK